jgi:RimJ/RimL family protein N-acetyltransferase
MKIRTFKLEDLKIMNDWLALDHIKKYWGEPNDWITEIKDNINADWVKYFMVEADAPIGFLQYYETDLAPKGEWSNEPMGTVGIDYLIGNSEYLGKGYGSKMIHMLIDLIKSKKEYNYIIADPINDNSASIKVLENLGFTQKSNGLYGLKLDNSGISLFRATNDDVNSITLVFRDTIQHVNAKDYPTDEIEDWSSWWKDHDKWIEKIQEQHFIIAKKDVKMVGFSSIAPDGYLDFMFTHKEYQGQGIATKLLHQIERKALQQGNETIYSDVSITAKSFFEKNGYTVEKQQLKKSRNKELINFRMIKRLKISSKIP